MIGGRIILWPGRIEVERRPSQTLDKEQLTTATVDDALGNTEWKVNIMPGGDEGIVDTHAALHRTELKPTMSPSWKKSLHKEPNDSDTDGRLTTTGWNRTGDKSGSVFIESTLIVIANGFDTSASFWHTLPFFPSTTT